MPQGKEGVVAKFSTPLEIYKLLPKTNCRQCRLPACLAFATAVIKGEKRLADCPYVTADVAARVDDDGVGARLSIEGNMEEAFARLQQEIAGIELAARAPAVGGRWEKGRLAVTCLGKDFFVFPDGTVTSQCHINPWLTIPLLEYVLRGSGVDPAGEWVAMRDLADGPTLSPLFTRRCEAPLQQLADRHPSLFEDLVGIFSGRATASQFDADVSIILHPLPKVPMLICYWQPEEELASRLNIFFDRTADRNLGVKLLHSLGVGLVTMFEKIGQAHG